MVVSSKKTREVGARGINQSRKRDLHGAVGRRSGEKIDGRCAYLDRERGGDHQSRDNSNFHHRDSKALRPKVSDRRHV